MKLRKIITMGIAAVMAVSAMSVTAMAEESTEVTTLTEVTGKIDYSIYDSDMVYIQEHADKIEEYNENLKKARATSYSEWSWSNGIYSRTTGKASGIAIPYYFVPTTTSMYFNVEVYDAGINNSSADETPYLTVNILNSDGSLSYVGSYNITKVSDHTYQWSNYKRSLSKGTQYVFSLLAATNWGSSVLDIYKTSM